MQRRLHGGGASNIGTTERSDSRVPLRHRRRPLHHSAWRLSGPPPHRFATGRFFNLLRIYRRFSANNELPVGQAAPVNEEGAREEKLPSEVLTCPMSSLRVASA
jgi:hypothetical protein